LFVDCRVGRKEAYFQNQAEQNGGLKCAISMSGALS
jgi:hypothetical protein